MHADSVKWQMLICLLTLHRYLYMYIYIWHTPPNFATRRHKGIKHWQKQLKSPNQGPWGGTIQTYIIYCIIYICTHDVCVGMTVNHVCISKSRTSSTDWFPASFAFKPFKKGLHTVNFESFWLLQLWDVFLLQYLPTFEGVVFANRCIHNFDRYKSHCLAAAKHVLLCLAMISC